MLLPVIGTAQKKEISLEDIYKKGSLRVAPVWAGFNEGNDEPEFKTDSLLDENGKLFGRAEGTVYNDKNPAIAIFLKGNEPVYRRSSKAFLYLYDDNTKKLVKLTKDKALHPSFSPDGKKLAYVMCGGDLSEPTLVSEQYLLDLEREAFLSLTGEKKTLERIQSVLKTGKPLRN